MGAMPETCGGRNAASKFYLSESELKLTKDHTDDNVEEKIMCLVCSKFGKEELWFRCYSCGRWAHKVCIGAPNAKNNFYDYYSIRLKNILMS